MIWNLLKNLFWCGVFHKPEYYVWGGDFSRPVDMNEVKRGDTLVCLKCYATVEVI